MRVAIVNDLAIATEALRRLVASQPDCTLAWTAPDGAVAVERCKTDLPDLVLMDLVMPVMDGVEATRRIMQATPCQILVVTATVEGHLERVYNALGAGAVDAVNCPTFGTDGSLKGGEPVVRKIRALRLVSAAAAKNAAAAAAPTPPITGAFPRITGAFAVRGSSTPRGVASVLLGSSTGGPQALSVVLNGLSKGFAPPIVVVQHLDPEFVPGLVEWLAAETGRNIRAIVAGDRPEEGTVLVACTNDHLVFSADGSLRYVVEPADEPYRPSVDTFFSSAKIPAVAPGVAVVLTGMGRDGAEGLLELRKAGWRTFAQDAATSVVYGMPRAAKEAGAAQRVLPLSEIGSNVEAAWNGLVAAEREDAHVTTPTAPDVAAPGGAEPGVTVLLVDDQALIGEAVRRMLVPEAGWKYRYVGDPRLAIAAAKEFHPTVILSDLVMPQMDGLELVRQFRADPETAKIPLIVLSSKEEAATKAEAFRLGANDYLVKLPDRIELVARLRYHTAGYVGMLQRDAAYRALRDDIEQAARYVESLLPAPLSERVVTRWKFIPSASLGGDAFGYHWLDDDHLALFLLDVSGHGVGAALLGVSVLNVLRGRSLPGTDFKDPGKVLEGLGGTFTMESQGGKFFTIWYGVYQASTRELRWAGGGHPPALLFPQGSAAPTPLGSGGPMPGMMPGLAYGTSSVSVPSGSRLLLYSDGLYEIRKGDGSAYSYEDFEAAMGAERPAGIAPLEAGLARAERLSAGRGYDDDVSTLEVTFP